MPHALKVNRELGIIEIRAFGTLKEDDMRETLGRLTAIAEVEGIKKVLADASDVVKGPTSTVAFDLFSHFPRDIRQAIYFGEQFPEEMLKELQFIEDVSVNSGHATMIFSNRDEALQWLLSDE